MTSYESLVGKKTLYNASPTYLFRLGPKKIYIHPVNTIIEYFENKKEN